MAVKFILDFVTSKHGLREIEEPIGIDGADFSIEQDEETYGRDIIFAGGSNKISVKQLPDQCFELLLFNLDKYGWEAIVLFKIDLDGDMRTVGMVDFMTASTDRVETFTFMIIEEKDRNQLKTNADNQNNLLSATDLFGKDIQPCITKSVLLKAVPIVQVSEWNTPVAGSVIAARASKLGDEFPVVNTASGVSFAFGQKRYNIEDSLSFFATSTALNGAGIPNLESFTYVQAQESISNLKIDLKNIDIKATWTTSNFADEEDVIQLYGSTRLVVRWGETLATSQLQIFGGDVFTDFDTETYTFGTEYTFTINELPRGHKVWIYVENDIDCDWNDDVPVSARAIITVAFNNMDVVMQGTSIAFDTVVPMIRLIDAMKYVVKATSGLNVVAPRFDIGGEYYNQYITNTQLMRRLPEAKINLSWKEIIEDFFPEPNGGYVIKSDKTVFIGYYEDFYKNIQLAEYDQEVISGFEQLTNEAYNFGSFKLKFDTFASQKEIQDGNTNTIIHGESEWKNGNARPPKAKEVKLGFPRDGQLLNENRVKAYRVSDSTATQDDDKIFIVDVVELPTDEREVIQTATLQHNAQDGKLFLNNDSTFSWVQLGIVENIVFQIVSGDNAGSYFVVGITDTQLTLQTGDTLNSYVESTTFIYEINYFVQLVNRTIEGFADIKNIEGGDKYPNLLFTNKRIIMRFWQNVLATAIRYTPKLPYRNTFYKNNQTAKTTLYTDKVLGGLVEAGDFTPTNPILEPYIYNIIVLMNLQEFLDLQVACRDINGFVKLFTSDGLPIKGHVRKAKWQFISKGCGSAEDYMGECEMTLEPRYEPFYMDIFGTGDGLIIINGEELGTSSFSFLIDEYENLTIFDASGKYMFKPIPYDRVRVNNSGQAASTVELQTWLNNLL